MIQDTIPGNIEEKDEAENGTQPRLESVIPVPGTSEEESSEQAVVDASPTSEQSNESDYHPIIIGNGLVVGGIIDGEWSQPDVFRDCINGNEEYQFISMDKGYLGNGIGSQMADFKYIHTLHDDFYPSLGAKCDWNLLPRSITVTKDKVQEYQELIDNYLNEKGEQTQDIDSIEIYSVDIQGDGISENLITVSSFGYIGEGKPGDFSMILLQQIDQGISSLTPIFESHSGNNFYDVIAVADMDGDGEFELLLHKEEMMGEESSMGTDTIYDWDTDKYISTISSQSSMYLETNLYASLDDAKKFLTPYGGRLIKEEQANSEGENAILLTYINSSENLLKSCLLYGSGSNFYSQEGQFLLAGFYKTSDNTLLWVVNYGRFGFYKLNMFGVDYSQPMFSLITDNHAFAPPISSISFSQASGSENDTIIYTTYYENNVQKQKINYFISRDKEKYELVKKEVSYTNGDFIHPQTVNDLIETYVQSVDLKLDEETEKLITNGDLMDFRKGDLGSEMWHYFIYNLNSLPELA